MDILQKLNAESELTIVLVTHEPDIACYAKRTVIFGDGKIRQDAPAENPLIAAEVLPHLPVIGEDLEGEEGS
ncbi:MAG: hypothetical protein HY238_13570 [Acidobacteria bacterium]|nr:hypothetical protein [Acidobacteriota bacterium]